MAQAAKSIVFTLLLRSIGKREDRGARYAGGFEAFLEGYAKCIMCRMYWAPQALATIVTAFANNCSPNVVRDFV